VFLVFSFVVACSIWQRIYLHAELPQQLLLARLLACFVSTAEIIVAAESSLVMSAKYPLGCCLLASQFTNSSNCGTARVENGFITQQCCWLGKHDVGLATGS